MICSATLHRSVDLMCEQLISYRLFRLEGRSGVVKMAGRFEDYLAALEAGDAAAVAQAVAQDTVLQVAVHAEPFRGRDTIAFIFEQLFSGILSGLRVRDVLADGARRVARFDVDVLGYDRTAEGLNYVELDAEGAMAEITVFLRPLDALQALSDEIGRRLGGPRPA